MSSDPTKLAMTNLIQFDGTNWNEFAPPMKAYMQYQGVWLLVKGYGTNAGLSRPPDSKAEDQAKWDEKNDKALGILYLYIRPHLLHIIDGKASIADAWKELEDTFKKPGAVGAFVYFQQLFNMVLDEHKALRPQLDAMQQFATRVTSDGITIAENLLALLMVNSLPRSYQVLGSTILATVTDVSALKPGDVITRVVEEESRRTANKQQHSVARLNPLDRKCEKCGKTNHTTEQHWPDGRRPTKSNNNNQQSSSGNQSHQNFGQNNGQRGGKGNKKKGKGQAHNVETNNSAQHIDILSIPTVPETALEKSTSVSVYALSATSSWIMDTGCTAHITPHKSNFQFYREFPEPGVARLAGQGQTIDIVGHGTVLLEHKNDKGRVQLLDLHNVLYVPRATSRYFAPRLPLLKGERQIFMDNSFLKVVDKGVDPQSDGVLIAARYNSSNLCYWLDAGIRHSPGRRLDGSANIMATAVDDYSLWHYRFGSTLR